MTKLQMLSALRDAGVTAEWYRSNGIDLRGAVGSPDPDSNDTAIACSASGWPAWPNEVSFKVILDRGRWYIETWAPYRYLFGRAEDVPLVAALLFSGAEIPADRAPARLPESFCRAHGLREIAPLEARVPQL